MSWNELRVLRRKVTSNVCKISVYGLPCQLSAQLTYFDKNLGRILFWNEVGKFFTKFYFLKCFSRQARRERLHSLDLDSVFLLEKPIKEQRTVLLRCARGGGCTYGWTKDANSFFAFKTNYFGWLVGNCWYSGFNGVEHAARSDKKLSWLFGWGLLLLLLVRDMWSEALRPSSGGGGAVDSTNHAGHNISKGTQRVAWCLELGSRSIMQILQSSFRYQFPYKISLFNVGLGALHGPLIHHMLPASVHRNVNVNFTLE
jgi:hypothetical protein